MISYYSIPPFITALLFALLGAYVFVKRRGASDTRIYALLCFETVYWQFCWTVLFSTKNPILADYLVRIGYSGIIFLPITFYHFVANFIGNQKRRRGVYLSYVAGLLFVVSVWTDSLFLRGFYTHRWGYYPRAGFLHPFFLLFLTLLLVDCFYLILKTLEQTQSTSRRNQIKWLIWAQLAYTCGGVDFVMNYGIDFYPFGFVFSLLSFFLITYAIMKHHLMDITLIIRKTLIYSIVTGLLTMIYISVAMLMVHLMQRWLGSNAAFSYAIATGVVTLVFNPLRNRVQSIVDKRFFRGSINREEILLELSNEIIRQKSPEQFTVSLLQVLEEALHPKLAALYLRSEEGNDFQNMSPGEWIPLRMSDDTVWTRSFNQAPHPLIQNQHTSDGGDPSQNLSGEVLSEMRRQQIMAAFPLVSKEKLLGYLFLGEKKSEEPYNNDDLLLLQSAINQTTLACERYLLDKGLQEAPQALETMASSFVHEIKTPMHNIKLPADLLLLYLKDVEDGKRSFQDIFPALKKHLGYIQEQSIAAVEKIEAIRQMSKKQKDNFTSLSPADLIRNSLSTLDQLIHQSNIQFTMAISEHLPSVYGNQQQLGIVFMNLVKNGIEAMMNDTASLRPKTLHVDGHEQGDWVVVTVEDAGPGIKPEHINKLFQVYFSTKGSAGTGMGLFLAQEVIKAHGGTIEVRSKFGQGTAFIVRLPAYREPSGQAVA